MSKINIGFLLGFLITSGIIIWSVESFKKGQISIIQRCDDNEYFFYNDSLYECKQFNPLSEANKEMRNK